MTTPGQTTAVRGRNEWRRTAEILLPCLLTLAAQTGLLWLAFTDRIGLLPFACFHLGIVLLVLGWAYTFRRGGRVNRFAMLLAVSGCFFGPLGTLGLAVITPLQVILRRQATPFEQWYSALFPEEEDDEDEKLYRMIASGRSANQTLSGIDSFTDVMRYGTIEQKRAVLMLLARRFRPEFAPALKLALQDANPAIRVQAATATAEIESGFTDRTIALEAAAKAAPQDFEHQLAMARHYDAYAFSGLLDSGREHASRRSALMYYGACLKLKPQDADIRMAISRILVREGRHADAVDWLGQRLDQDRSSRAIVGWYLECLFHLGRFAELRGIAARFGDLLLDAGDEEDRLQQSARLWLDSAKAAS
ncbi:hypothetical protein [Ferrovibrio xuzhouensis]|uniref:HEAT repeat protein n=1 Tax=Ferrovibrio xuzhouensis TaxID=1576914 RepID=A0ABV7VBJ6_9PROT